MVGVGVGVGAVVAVAGYRYGQAGGSRQRHGSGVMAMYRARVGQKARNWQKSSGPRIETKSMLA